MIHRVRVESFSKFLILNFLSYKIYSKIFVSLVYFYEEAQNCKNLEENENDFVKNST